MTLKGCNQLPPSLFLWNPGFSKSEELGYDSPFFVKQLHCCHQPVRSVFMHHPSRINGIFIQMHVEIRIQHIEPIIHLPYRPYLSLENLDIAPVSGKYHNGKLFRRSHLKDFPSGKTVYWIGPFLTDPFNGI